MSKITLAIEELIKGAQDRLVSGARAGEEQYEDTMKVLVDMGFNIKDQVKKNGKAVLSISSHNH